METFVRGHSFEVAFTLNYKDLGTAIDLEDSSITEITIEIIDQLTETVLLTRLLSDSDGVVITGTGECSIYINGEETEDAEAGKYSYIAQVEVANTYFSGNSANFGCKGEAFILV